MKSIPIERLAAWMDAHSLGEGPLEDLEPLGGGTQNIIIRFRRSGRTYVFRRPPVHLRANSNETMRREARVLAALADTDVPHARLIAACPDESVTGTSFYLMESVNGFNPAAGLPEPEASDTRLQHAIGMAMVAALAALGRVDPAQAGLEHFGRLDRWLERQVSRWRSQFESYSELDHYPGPELDGVEEVGAWLEAHRPASIAPGLIHGDFHFANVLVAPGQGRLAAVVDWELATLGDPLLDLGHLLATWPDGSEESLVPELVAPGLPGRDELVARYSEYSGRDVSDIDWFEVLAGYRLAILLEGTHARAGAGHAPVEVGERLHGLAAELLRRAHARLA